MLRLHNPNNSAEVFPLDGLGPAITHPFDGFDTLSFDIPMSHEYYPLIAEEVRISTKDNRFAVKSVDEHGDVCTVECMLDLDDWKERFWKEYRTTDALLSEVLNEIKPTGWTVEGAGISTQHKTIEASEGKPLELVNSMDILGRATEVYEVCVNFNVPDKRLKVIDPSTYTPLRRIPNRRVESTQHQFHGKHYRLCYKALCLWQGRDDLCGYQWRKRVCRGFYLF